MIETAYYQSNVSTFLTVSQDQILGELTNHYNFPLELPQKNAWIEQISNMKEQLRDFRDGHIFLEFSIPRMGKRVDLVLVVRGLICVIEYKVGAKTYEKHAIDQVMDYAVDLKNFHEGSHDKHIVPILVSTNARDRDSSLEWSADLVALPLLANGQNLAQVIEFVLSKVASPQAFDRQPGLLARTSRRPQSSKLHKRYMKDIPSRISLAQMQVLQI